MSGADWPVDTTKVLAHWVAGDAFTEQLVDWATRALTAGHDSPALRELASTDLEESPRLEGISETFQRALDDLGIAMPEKQDHLRRYLHLIAKQIVEGTVDPRSGVEEIHLRVLTPLEHPQDLMSWCYLWEGNDARCTRPLEEGEVGGAILGWARLWCERESDRP